MGAKKKMGKRLKTYLPLNSANRITNDRTPILAVVCAFQAGQFVLNRQLSAFVSWVQQMASSYSYVSLAILSEEERGGNWKGSGGAVTTIKEAKPRLWPNGSRYLFDLRPSKPLQPSCARWAADRGERSFVSKHRHPRYHRHAEASSCLAFAMSASPLTSLILRFALPRLQKARALLESSRIASL
jgi:hypothetical protein